MLNISRNIFRSFLKNTLLGVFLILNFSWISHVNASSFEENFSKNLEMFILKNLAASKGPKFSRNRFLNVIMDASVPADTQRFILFYSNFLLKPGIREEDGVVNIHLLYSKNPHEAPDDFDRTKHERSIARFYDWCVAHIATQKMQDKSVGPIESVFIVIEEGRSRPEFQQCVSTQILNLYGISLGINAISLYGRTDLEIYQVLLMRSIEFSAARIIMDCKEVHKTLEKNKIISCIKNTLGNNKNE